jgi:predicted NBD/HSP70 family sugar kinase
MNLDEINIKEAIIVIKFLLDKGNCASRKDILEAAPWGSSKTDLILKTLRERSILQKDQDDHKVSRRGRVEYKFSLNPNLGLFLGVELSNFFDRYVLADFSGKALACKEYSPSYRAVDISGNIIININDFLSTTQKVKQLPILGITLGLHGLFHETQGQLLQPMDSSATINLNIKNVIQENFNIPVSACHPRHLILLEKYGFEKKHITDKYVLNLIQGYGIGIGISIRGEFINGATNLTGEIGHIQVPGNKIKCYCGKEGCLRTLVSYRGIVEKAIQMIEEHHATSLDINLLKTSAYESSVERIIDAALEKDTLSMMIVHDTAVLLGSYIAMAVTLFNPDLLVIHSNLIRAKEVFSSPLLYHLETEALPKSVQNLKIDFTPYPPFAIATGATKHALVQYLETLSLLKESSV